MIEEHMKMKKPSRRMFAGLFGGIAAGATATAVTPTAHSLSPAQPAAAENKNGVCPNCGEKAAPYVRDVTMVPYWVLNGNPVSIAIGTYTATTNLAPYKTTSSGLHSFGICYPDWQELVRCKKCSTAFYQDAVDPVVGEQPQAPPRKVEVY